MIRAVFLAGLILLGVLVVLLVYRSYIVRVRAEKETEIREMEHEERKELFDDE